MLRPTTDTAVTIALLLKHMRKEKRVYSTSILQPGSPGHLAVSQLYLDLGGFGWDPLHERDSPAQHEDREPLQPTEGAAQHQHCAQGRARDLQLVRHLEKGHNATQHASVNCPCPVLN